MPLHLLVAENKAYLNPTNSKRTVLFVIGNLSVQAWKIIYGVFVNGGL
jgi:hypothetical protein